MTSKFTGLILKTSQMLILELLQLLENLKFQPEVSYIPTSLVYTYDSQCSHALCFSRFNESDDYRLEM